MIATIETTEVMKRMTILTNCVGYAPLVFSDVIIGIFWVTRIRHITILWNCISSEPAQFIDATIGFFG